MTRSRYKIYDAGFPYFITSSIVDGIPLFADPDLAKIILDAIVFLQNKNGVTVYAYVIVENHVHFVVKGEYLAKKIKDFKSFTAREIVNLLKNRKRNRLLWKLKQAKLTYKTQSEFQVWQEGYHPKQIIGDDMMIQKIEYIHYNPVKRGYVDRPEHWRYSSMRNYLGEEGLIPITFFGSEQMSI